MSFKISNSRVHLKGQFTFNKLASQLLGTGAIMRVVGLQPVSNSISYIGIDGNLAVSPEFNIDSPPLYILVLSGSVSSQDEAPFNFFEGVYTTAIINTLITGSTTGSAFTEQIITTPGSGNWTKPTGVTQVIVECWGGGGAGGGATLADSAGGGGAGGQYARKLIIYPTASQSIPYVVAASVAGGTGVGATGNDTTWDTNVVVAKGGEGGQPNGTGGFSPAAGGIATTVGGIGDIIHIGSDGGFGVYTTSPFQAVSGYGGGGPGSAGSAAGPEYGGLVANEISLTSGGSNGNPGNNYGGGGGGAAKISGPNRSGGAGAQGLIRIIYR